MNLHRHFVAPAVLLALLGATAACSTSDEPTSDSAQTTLLTAWTKIGHEGQVKTCETFATSPTLAASQIFSSSDYSISPADASYFLNSVC